MNHQPFWRHSPQVPLRIDQGSALIQAEAPAREQFHPVHVHHWELGLILLLVSVFCVGALARYLYWYRTDRNRFFPHYWKSALAWRWLAASGSVLGLAWWLVYNFA